MVGGKSDVSGETEGCDEWVKSIVASGTFSTVPSQRANLCFRTHIKLVLSSLSASSFSSLTLLPLGLFAGLGSR